jgi:hypothetical protein
LFQIGSSSDRRNWPGEKNPMRELPACDSMTGRRTDEETSMHFIRVQSRLQAAPPALNAWREWSLHHPHHPHLSAAPQSYTDAGAGSRAPDRTGRPAGARQDARRAAGHRHARRYANWALTLLMILAAASSGAWLAVNATPQASLVDRPYQLPHLVDPVRLMFGR